MSLYLFLPTAAQRVQVEEFKQAFQQAGEDTINGSCGLTRFSCYGDWLFYLERVRQGREPDRVPSFTFLAGDGKQLVGIIDIRLQLAQAHYYSGHIGYSVRPDCRGRGIGTELLRLGLEKARKLGLGRVMLSCQENNLASRKIIETNGGRLSERAVWEGAPLLVFWISLSDGNQLSSQKAAALPAGFAGVLKQKNLTLPLKTGILINRYLMKIPSLFFLRSTGLFWNGGKR